MARRKRPGARTDAAVGLVFVSIGLPTGGAMFLVCPTCLSGGYCKLTVHDVTTRPDGRGFLHHDDPSAWGTLVEWVSLRGPRGWGSSSTLGRNLDEAFLH